MTSPGLFTPISVALVLAATGASCFSPDPLIINDLVEGDFVHGELRVSAQLEASEAYLRSDLWVDELRESYSLMPRSGLDWDTRKHLDGPHRLRVRVQHDDGSSLEASLTVVVDNTSPVIGQPPSTAVQGRTYSLEVADALAMDRSEVVPIPLSSGAAETLPWPVTTLLWPWPCATSILVRAYDRAGNVKERTFPVAVTRTDGGSCAQGR